MNTTPDPRRGVPSASTMSRLIACHASFHMEQAAPAETESNDEAASGTRIHSVLAHKADASTLNAAEIETLEMCLDQRQQLLTEWNEGNPMLTPDVTLLETRLGLTSSLQVMPVTPESKERFIFTGEPDLVCIKGERAIIIDYKTGRGNTAKALENPQLASLTVLVWMAYPQVKTVRVCIVQPWAGKPTISDYSTNALTLAKSWLLETLRQVSEATPQDTKAGEHCQWCRAKAGCEAFKLAALKEIEVVQPMTLAGMEPETQSKALFARAMELPAPSLAGAVKGLSMVKRYVAAIEGAAKARAAEDAEFQQYFTLREKKGRRSICDVQAVFRRCTEHGVTPEQFTAICSATLGDLKDLLRTATGEKGKSLDAITEGVLEGACEVGKGSLELVEVEV